MFTAASTVTTAALFAELSKRLEEVNLAEEINGYNKMNGKAKGQGQASEASTSDAARPMDVDGDSGPGKTGPELPPIPEVWDSDLEEEYVMIQDKRPVKMQPPSADGHKSSAFKQGRKVRCSTCQDPKHDASWRSVKNTKVQVGDQWFWDYCCADCLRKENPGMT